MKACFTWRVPKCLASGLGSILLQASDRNVIHNLLHFLHIILEGVKFLSEVVILEVQEPKPGSNITDEGGYVEGSLVVPQYDAVHRKSRLQKNNREKSLCRGGESYLTLVRPINYDDEGHTHFYKATVDTTIVTPIHT